MNDFLIQRPERSLFELAGQVDRISGVRTPIQIANNAPDLPKEASLLEAVCTGIKQRMSLEELRRGVVMGAAFHMLTRLAGSSSLLRLGMKVFCGAQVSGMAATLCYSVGAYLFGNGSVSEAGLAIADTILLLGEGGVGVATARLRHARPLQAISRFMMNHEEKIVPAVGALCGVPAMLGIVKTMRGRPLLDTDLIASTVMNKALERGMASGDWC